MKIHKQVSYIQMKWLPHHCLDTRVLLSMSGGQILTPLISHRDTHEQECHVCHLPLETGTTSCWRLSEVPRGLHEVSELDPLDVFCTHRYFSWTGLLDFRIDMEPY